MENTSLNIVSNSSQPKQILQEIEIPISEMKGSEIQERNMKHYKDRTIESFKPTAIWLEPTALCNLKCVMCPHEGEGLERQKGLMDMDLFRKIIDEVSAWKPAIKFYHTGESLIHPKLGEMIIYAKSKGCFTMLNTNATLLDERKAQMILDTPLDYLSFSFDGSTKDIYEKIRIGGDFDKTLSNILRFLEMKKEQGNKRLYTRIEMIRMEDTEEDIDNFKEKFSSLPLDSVGIKRLMNWGGQIEVKGEIKEEFTDLNCLHPWTFASILWDGKVVPCCRDAHAKHVLGDMNENKLLDIWNKHYKMLHFRRTLAENNGYKNIDICKNCDEVLVDRISDEDKRMLG
tara:strand:- start:2753 stop:3781 length:1029 start_codon:yes stop_codon:yes gene_type:complete